MAASVWMAGGNGRSLTIGGVISGAGQVLLDLPPQTEAWTKQEGCLRLLRGPDDLEDFAVEVPPVNWTTGAPT